MSIKPLWGNEKLAEAIKQGNITAFEFLFNQHYGALVGYITMYTKNQQLSEDIAQYSFISLWESRDNISTNFSPKNYLYTIAYNHYIDLYRKEKRKNALLEELRLENLYNRIEEDKDIFDLRLKKLGKIIEQLPPRCKEILILSRKRGLEYNEIAEKLKISPRTVEEQIRIAFKKIRKGFENGKFLLFFFRKVTNY